MTIKNSILHIKNSSAARRILRRKNELETYVKAISRVKQVEQKFCIFAQGRTGSTLLCDLLNSHPQIHCDKEILYHHVLFPQLYIDGKLKKSSKNIYGFKVKIYQLSQDQNIKDPNLFLQRLHQENWKIIYLRRNNLFRHALSSLIAESRKQWHIKKQHEAVKYEPVSIDCDRLLEIISSRQKLLRQEENSLEGIPHITINYETDLLDQTSQQRSVNMICDSLGIDSSQVETSLSRIVSDNLESMLKNHAEVISRMTESEYSEYLSL